MRKNTEAVYHILALVLEYEGCMSQAYICKVTNQNLRQVYKRHYTGRNSYTACWFQTRSPESRIRMYELESKEMDSLTAYVRYINWIRFFWKNSYLIANPDFDYLRYQDSDDAIYQEISQNNLKELCADEKDLAMKWHFAEPEYTVKFSISHERHMQLRKEAGNHNLSFDEYCQAKFDEAEIRCPSINELYACSQKIREVHNMADNIRKQKLLRDGNTVILKQLADSLSDLATNVASLESAILRLTEAKNDC